MDLFLLSLPWMAVLAYLLLFFRNPRRLGEASAPAAEEAPFVSVIVPARDEEENIGSCVRSLMASDYPAFEILVVDDGSRDRTRDIVTGIAEESMSVRLVPGEPLPEGWFGKPWACWQGAAEAKGDVLLFTDADTVHGPGLLARVVSGMKEDRADALTVIGRQIMGSFWEQLIQPQFFMLLAARYPRTHKLREPRHWRHAIANGQYLLFRREVYEGMDGHKAVAHEVVEDLRLAQILVRGGWRLSVRQDHGLQTRMYRSLSGLVEGWSKNVVTAALQTTARWLLPVILPLSFVLGILLWLLPPAVLSLSLLMGTRGLAFSWSTVTTGLSLFVWTQASVRMKGNPLAGLLFPLGAALGLYIFVKSWARGTQIQWKGREYQMGSQAEG